MRNMNQTNDTENFTTGQDPYSSSTIKVSRTGELIIGIIVSEEKANR
jgi:hypothetical protein